MEKVASSIIGIVLMTLPVAVLLMAMKEACVGASWNMPLWILGCILYVAGVAFVLIPKNIKVVKK